MVAPGLIGFAVIITVVALVALGMAFLLDVVARGMALGLRSMVAAAVSALLAIAIPVSGVLPAIGRDEFLVVLLPLLILGVVLALLVGSPVAYFFSRRRERKRTDPVKPEVFE